MTLPSYESLPPWMSMPGPGSGPNIRYSIEQSPPLISQAERYRPTGRRMSRDQHTLLYRIMYNRRDSYNSGNREQWWIDVQNDYKRESGQQYKSGRKRMKEWRIQYEKSLILSTRGGSNFDSHQQAAHDWFEFLDSIEQGGRSKQAVRQKVQDDRQRALKIREQLSSRYPQKRVMDDDDDDDDYSWDEGNDDDLQYKVSTSRSTSRSRPTKRARIDDFDSDLVQEIRNIFLYIKNSTPGPGPGPGLLTSQLQQLKDELREELAIFINNEVHDIIDNKLQDIKDMIAKISGHSTVR